jgi:hypothetical protein
MRSYKDEKVRGEEEGESLCESAQISHLHGADLELALSIFKHF